MTTIVQNPTTCCPTCDNFAECEVCNGGASLMKLSVTIEGAPNDSYQCLVCPGSGAGSNRRIMWSNLNGNYELEQDYAGSSSFHLNFVSNCTEAQSGGKLIEDNEQGCCYGEDLQLLGLLIQTEVYVTGIQASLECVNNQMRIAGISFTICSCTRVNSIPPPPSNDPQGPWSDWSCEPDEDYPGYEQPFTCWLADHTATASPCSGQRMQRELLWPPVLKSSECLFYFSCEDETYPPTVSQLKAQLAC